MKELKIFTYQIENGEMIEENLYSDFLFVFNNLIAHNFINENDKLNIIISTEFPPKDFIYSNKQWVTKKSIMIKEYDSLVKFF